MTREVSISMLFNLRKLSSAGFGLIGIIIAVAIIGLLTGTGWYWKKTQTRAPQMPSAQQANQPDVSTWKTYRNEKYGFEVRYPSNYFISIQSEPIPFVNVCNTETRGCRPFLVVSVRPVATELRAESEYLVMFPETPNFARGGYYYYLRERITSERMDIEVIADEIKATFKFIK